MRRTMTLTLVSGRVISNKTEINNFLRRHRRKSSKDLKEILGSVHITAKNIQSHEERIIGILSSYNGTGTRQQISEIPDIIFAFGKPRTLTFPNSRKYFFRVTIHGKPDVTVRADVLVTGAPLTTISDVDKELFSGKVLSVERRQKLVSRREQLLEELKEAIAKRLNSQ